jgi:broad specificity phosphatase PhoE
VSAIYLVRHGQASFGRSDYDKLSELGEEQARLLGVALRQRVPQVHVALTGAMLRHKQTAQGCLEAMLRGTGRRAHPVEDAGFNEFDHDELIARYKPRYENRLVLAAELAATLRPRQAFQEMFAEAVARWIGGQHDGDYKESWPVFQARCVEALVRVGDALGSGETAMVFTSAGTITAIFQHLLEMPLSHAFKMNWTMVNCGVTKVIRGSRGFHLSSLNDHGHFEGEAKRLVTYR